MEASSCRHMHPQSDMGTRGQRTGEASSSSHHQAQHLEESIQKMSDAFFKFYEPTPSHTADLDIFFFHGLESEGANVNEAHISTWRSGGEEGEVWPRSWVPEDFPQARVIAVRYDCCVRKMDTAGKMDLYMIGENLVQEIVWARKEHGHDRPVILVGHGFGGIVMKMLCVYSKNRKGKSVGGSDMAMFLDSVRGFFFYSTPHLGIEGIEAPTENEGPLLSWLRALNSQSSRLHEEFCELWRERSYRWIIFGLGETKSTAGGQRLRVPEASSRFGDRYITVASDHFDVCRPSDRSSSKYQHLKMLIEDIKRRAEFERQQSLRVSDVTVGVDVLVTEVLGKHLRHHKFVGFSGMGGVGKTTLAKLIFNKVCAKFEFTCFVEEIKWIPGTKEEVKKRVWEKMRRHGVPVSSATGVSGDGWYQVAGKSLFLVFDDVDDTEHIDLLKEIAHDNGDRESRFVLTSRNAQLLQDFGDDACILPLDCLHKQDAMKLFLAYAFHGQEPPEPLREVVEKVVDGCGGLPLSLEVLGKYLRNKDPEKYIGLWVEIPGALRKCDKIANLEERVWAKLELSYDGLPGTEVQSMFLDIVSFFPSYRVVGLSTDDVRMAWSSLYGSVINRLQLLEDRSLLRVHRYKDEDRMDRISFQMHEHVRGMGKRIARRIGRTFDLSLSRSSASSSSRDHSYDDRIVSQDREELGKTVALRVIISSESTPVSAEICHSCTMLEVLPKLTAVQYMRLDLTGSELKCCKQCKNRVVVLPSSLVSLWISGSTSNLVVPVDAGRNLALLNCQFVHSFSRMVALATCTSLVKLVLYHCGNLGDLRHGLSQLQRLRVLEIAKWSGTGDWLESLGKLTSLERLALSVNHEPFDLPLAFGQLTKLQYLSLWRCEVTYIPISFRNLTSLQFLRLGIGDRQVIPNVIGDLQQLRVLKIKCWAVDGFMETIGQLTGLESLALDCGGIFELPESLGKLTRLEELEIACPADAVPGSLMELGCLKKLKLVPIGSLPDSFKNLSNLKYLEPECPHLTLQAAAGALNSTTSVSLELPGSEHGIPELQASNLFGLRLASLEITVQGPQIVPDCFGGLQRLREFSLQCLAVENNLVESFRNLTALQSLTLRCAGITQLPAEFGCFTTLSSLTLECSAVQALPETFGKFSQLQRADIRCSDLRSLPDSFGQLVKLLSFTLRGSEHLSTLPDTVGSLTNLETLMLFDCRIQSLPASFTNLIRLQRLKLVCEDGAVAVAVRNLVNLETLEIRVIAGQLVRNIFGQLQKLERLTLECHTMGNLVESFQNLCSLVYLRLSCKTVEELPREIGCLTTLMDLSIACPSLQSLPVTLPNCLKL